jgi:hypothetical protein
MSGYDILKKYGGYYFSETTGEIVRKHSDYILPKIKPSYKNIQYPYRQINKLGKTSGRPSTTVPQKIKKFPQPHWTPESLDIATQLESVETLDDIPDVKLFVKLLQNFKKNYGGQAEYGLPLKRYCGWCWLYKGKLVELPFGWKALCGPCIKKWIRIGGRKKDIPKPETNYFRRQDYSKNKISKERYCEHCGRPLKVNKKGKSKAYCNICISAHTDTYKSEINRGIKVGKKENQYITHQTSQNLFKLGTREGDLEHPDVLKDKYNKEVPSHNPMMRLFGEINKLNREYEKALDDGDKSKAKRLKNRIEEEAEKHIKKDKQHNKDKTSGIYNELESYLYDHLEQIEVLEGHVGSYWMDKFRKKRDVDNVYIDESS